MVINNMVVIIVVVINHTVDSNHKQYVTTELPLYHPVDNSNNLILGNIIRR